jgi:hypothetical protein
LWSTTITEVIFKIDAGGKDVLRLLGFEVTTEEECVKAISCLWVAVETYFSPSKIHKMGVEPITLKHTLCKSKRLYGKYISMVHPYLFLTKFNLTSGFV